jgi:hypothetical protein
MGFVAELLLAHSAFLLAFIFRSWDLFSLSLARIPLRRTNPRRGENNCQHLVRENKPAVVPVSMYSPVKNMATFGCWLLQELGASPVRNSAEKGGRIEFARRLCSAERSLVF